MSPWQRFLLWLRIPVVLVGLGLALGLYNRFLVDANLQTLETSLSILESADNVGQAEAALILVDQALVTAMSQEEQQLQNVVNLQYSEGTLAPGRPDRPVADTHAMVAMAMESASGKRRETKATLDALAGQAQELFQKAIILPRRLKAGRLTDETDPVRLAEADRLERTGNIRGAVRILEELLELFPDYEKRATLRLRLGYLYQKTQALDEAEAAYQAAADQALSTPEIQAAGQALRNLQVVRQGQSEVPVLEQRFSVLSAGPGKAKAAHRLGSALLRIHDLKEAAEKFALCRALDPDGKLAQAAQFKQGWCLKSLGQWEAAEKLFGELIEADPKGKWGAAARLQLAEMDKTIGNVDSALQRYETALQQTEDKAFASIILAHAGSTYLIDKNDPATAQRYFQELSKTYPASPSSTIENRIRKQLTGRKGPSPLAVAPSASNPLLNWLEGTLPLVVEVFAQRLTRYMEVVDETEMERRFTEAEFKELVIRRVEEQFPGQLTQIEVRITPDGYVGSTQVNLGVLKFKVSGRAGITVINERPHAVIHEMQIGNLSVPEPLFKLLERRVNEEIDKLRLSIRVIRYELYDGYALIRVERNKE
ncbi:MAG: hypothetical protein COV76_02190 [Candidatus Omnitrophica bacterium CG11_big_fil_rev_8_21_14_0_20_64_10]|nr:MAG: hypothetical protein COV76_02190 [Candidatus Omnitrophica bacterium CG11_big_fil_rev_8_21_14_0_20_64_10]